jgi:hypothetical protein
MRRLFTYTCLCIVIIALAVPTNIAHSFAAPPQQRDTAYNFFPKKKTKKSPLSFTLPPIKAGAISNIKLNVPKPDDKLLSSVEVYPNPITDQINLRYVVSKNTNVTIKMVDVLGNDVLTLFSRRVDPGEQIGSFPIAKTMNKGFYFIRVIAGTESVIKRISIL